jgi:HYDIN/CFA65/VesB-like, Ig-like domain/NB-ARC domain/Domain of unknown function (DUF4062)
MRPTIASVFVSSNWLDLQPEREAVQAALRQMREAQFIGLDTFGSRVETSRQLDVVDQSQIYLGIFGGRHGTGDTEDEYRRARELSLPCFIYFKDEASIPPESREPDPEKAASFQAFKNELASRHPISSFSGPKELVQKIIADLHRWSFYNSISGKSRERALGSMAIAGEGEGGYRLEADLEYGGVVYRDKPPQWRSRPVPLAPGVQRPQDLLDRTAEVNAAMAAWRSATPVEFYGEPGVGKTYLLRHLAFQTQKGQFPDGVIYLDQVGERPIRDVLQLIFDSFVESDTPYRPRDAELRQLLDGKRALILMDDVELESEELERVMKATRQCLFTLASNQRRVPGDSLAVHLQGLPPEEGAALFASELGRELTGEELEVAKSLCVSLGGNPLRIQQAAAIMLDSDWTLAEVALKFGAEPTSDDLLTQAVSYLSESEMRVLAALSSLGGAPLAIETLSDLTEIEDLGPVIEPMIGRRLIESNGSDYQLTGELNEFLHQLWKLDQWRERALGYFTDWAEEHCREPNRIMEELDAISRILEWAERTGRLKEFIRLGRAIDHGLILSGQWDTWEYLLQWILQSARVVDDFANEAWALHQLGTRALCMENKGVAKELLSQALDQRIALGDHDGASVTRHNLELLLLPVPAPAQRPIAPAERPSVTAERPAVNATLTPGTRNVRPEPRPPSRFIPLGIAALIIGIGLFASKYVYDLIQGQNRSPEMAVLSAPSTPTPAASVKPGIVEPRVQPSVEPSVRPTEPAVANLTFSPGDLNFGELPVETRSSPKTVKITNSGSAPLTIESVNLTNSDNFAITGNDCKTLEPRKSCAIRVSFISRTAGDHSASLIARSNAANPPGPVTLAGRSVERTIPSIKYFEARPSTIVAGKQASLCYQVSNAISARVDPEIGEVIKKGANLEDGKDCVSTPRLNGTRTFKLTAKSRTGQTVTREATVTIASAKTDISPKATPVSKQPPRILSFYSKSDTIQPGKPAYLCYSMSNAARAFIEPGGSPIKNLKQDCVEVKPVERTTYTLTAISDDGVKATRFLTVNAGLSQKTTAMEGPPRILYFEATPAATSPGGRTRICYGVSQASEVRIQPYIAPLKAAETYCATTTLTQTTSFLLTASNPKGQIATREITVKVNR